MSGEPPIWLSEEPEIVALLNTVLDRFDRQPGEARQRVVSLAVEKCLPSLARADAHADQLWGLIGELGRRGVLEMRTVRRNPYDPEWDGARLAFPAESEPVLREWLGREWSEPAMQLWRRAVQTHAHAFPGECEALLKRRVVIEGRSAEEVVAAFASIKDIREPATLRQLSAYAFWGDSKVLDDRGDLVAALFPQLEIRERALVVAVYLPRDCREVIFIENQDTYTAAIAGWPAPAEEYAVIYAAGFRGAAARVRTRTGAVLHYAGPGAGEWRSRFESWWYDDGEPLGPQWFWGDLDFAGMQILKALRTRFPGLSAWPPGYGPMLAALRTSGGYRPALQNQGQADPGSTGCEYADTVLLPAIRDHGHLDQECPPPG